MLKKSNIRRSTYPSRTSQLGHCVCCLLARSNLLEEKWVFSIKLCSFWWLSGSLLDYEN